jgi:hypothetical protein
VLSFQPIMVYTRSVDRDSITRFILQDSVLGHLFIPVGTISILFLLAKSLRKVDRQYVDNTESKLFSGAGNTVGQPCVRNIFANLKNGVIGREGDYVANLQSNIS